MRRRWIDLTRTGPAAERCLLCFPYSGAGAQAFQDMAGHMPAGTALHALELPGRGRRFPEPRLETLDEMVEDAVADLPLIVGDRPVVCYGHSLGGLVAFETVRLLQQHLDIRHLFVSGVRAPQAHHHEDRVERMDDETFLSKLREMGGTPEELLRNAEMREIILPILRSDFCAYESYVFTRGRPLSCPLTAMGGRSDSLVSEEDLKLWSIHTRTFACHLMDGGHFVLHSQLEKILAILRPSLN